MPNGSHERVRFTAKVLLVGCRTSVSYADAAEARTENVGAGAASNPRSNHNSNPSISGSAASNKNHIFSSLPTCAPTQQTRSVDRLTAINRCFVAVKRKRKRKKTSTNCETSKGCLCCLPLEGVQAWRKKLLIFCCVFSCFDRWTASLPLSPSLSPSTRRFVGWAGPLHHALLLLVSWARRFLMTLYF